MVIAVRTQRAVRHESEPETKYDSRPAPGVSQGQPYGDYVADSREVGRVRPAALRQGHDEAFQELAERWRAETVHVSSTHDVVLHPAYLQIIGLGMPIVPLLLRELQKRPEPWFWALTALTGDDPTVETSTFDEAVQAWLSWGRDKGYLSAEA